MRIFANADYPFLSWRRKAYFVFGLLLSLGLGAMVFNFFSVGSWLTYGVDFSGGTVVQVDFDEPVEIEQIRAVNSDWDITRFGEPSAYEFLIRVPTFETDLDSDPTAGVAPALAGSLGQDAFEVIRTEAVSGRVGDELQQRAFLAILISFVLTLAYLAFRFEWRFGVAAVITTAHDILITLGFVALFRMDVSITTVAAFLTIVGYSLNDTIVIFDRIRENLANRKRGVGYAEIIDHSINETLPRTIITAVTSLATLTALYLFGGAVIRDFAFILILGLIVGTFSTIFIASPALATIEAKWPRRPTRSPRGAGASQRRQTARV